jgi:hypothetical protein
MPFDTAGRYIGQPRFPTTPFKPGDIEFFIKRQTWIRKIPNDAWTTAQNRAVILDWLSSFMLSRNSWARSWKVLESNTDARSSTLFSKYPKLILTIFDTSGQFYEVGLIMSDVDIDNDAQLRSKLDQAGAALDHLQSM